MKNILLILPIIFLNSLSHAQDKNILKNSARIGIHGAYYNDENIYMPMVSAEYSHWLSSNLAIVPRLMRSVDVTSGKYPWDLKASFTTSISLRLSPFRGWFNRLNFDFGGFYQRFKSGHGLFDYYGGPLDYYDIKNTGGLMGALNFNFIDKNKLESGFRTELLTNIARGYFKCESVQAGVYLGMKF